MGISLCLINRPLSAQSQVATIAEWTVDSVRSTVLNEVRRINIALPATYRAKAFAEERYPVLIVLDGQPTIELGVRIESARRLSRADAPMFPEMIVVGVETDRNRVRDMSPPLSGQEARTDRGGAPAFATFLKSELLPWLSSRYRTAPYTVIAGHSMSGLFAAWAYGHHPDAFNAAIVLSPSLWWYQPQAYQLVLQGIRSRTAPGSLFVAASDVEGLQIAEVTRQLGEDMKRVPTPATTFTSHRYTDATHSHVELLGFSDGLRSIFRPLSLTGMESAMHSRAQFEREFTERRRRYVEAAPRFGLPPRLPVVFTFNLAGAMVADSSLRAAVPMLCEELRASHGGLWQRYACDGEYKLAEKDLAGAEAAFSAGLQMAEQEGFAGAIPIFRNGIERVGRARR